MQLMINSKHGLHISHATIVGGLAFKIPQPSQKIIYTAITAIGDIAATLARLLLVPHMTIELFIDL